jgi:uncharacterized protein YdhG (YjbR/CyaY superfamily)
MPNTKYQSVDDYLASQPEATQRVLQRVRNAIRAAVPKAEELISYQIPAYKLDGQRLIYFAGWKQHYSIYPAGERLVAEFQKELAPYKISKGTIQFPLDEPVPAKLIGRIAKYRAHEVAGKGRIST